MRARAAAGSPARRRPVDVGVDARVAAVAGLGIDAARPATRACARRSGSPPPRGVRRGRARGQPDLRAADRRAALDPGSRATRRSPAHPSRARTACMPTGSSSRAARPGRDLDGDRRRVRLGADAHRVRPDHRRLRAVALHAHGDLRPLRVGRAVDDRAVQRPRPGARRKRAQRPDRDVWRGQRRPGREPPNTTVASAAPVARTLRPSIWQPPLARDPGPRALAHWQRGRRKSTRTAWRRVRALATPAGRAARDAGAHGRPRARRRLDVERAVDERDALPHTDQAEAARRRCSVSKPWPSSRSTISTHSSLLGHPHAGRSVASACLMTFVSASCTSR